MNVTDVPHPKTHDMNETIHNSPSPTPTKWTDNMTRVGATKFDVFTQSELTGETPDDLSEEDKIKNHKTLNFTLSQVNDLFRLEKFGTFW
eukprot:gene24533-10519_t